MKKQVKNNMTVVILSIECETIEFAFKSSSEAVDLFLAVDDLIAPKVPKQSAYAHT